MTEATNTVEGADLAPETADCTAPETCGVCHTCQRQRPCPCETSASDPWAGFEDHGKCESCGKTKDRVIRRRFGNPDKRRLCDDCHEETKR